MHSGTHPFPFPTTHPNPPLTSCSQDGYHIYRDRTNFLYDITLARIDLLTNRNERYSLKVPPPLPLAALLSRLYSNP